MTIKVEINPEIEARLKAGAKARGLSLEEYAETLLREAVRSRPEGTGRLTPDELNTMLRQIAQGAENLPTIPTSAFTRESFYEDRQ